MLILIALAHQSVRAPARRAHDDRAGRAGGGADGSRPRRSASACWPAPGVWLLLRPRTFQVIIGLSLLSYAVNLFIFSMGRLRVGAPPILASTSAAAWRDYADPVPQALVLTAIVIGFATTALFLVVLLAARGLTGTDHVDGRER